MVRNYYDSLSRVTKTVSGYGTVDAGNDIEIAYTENGQVFVRKDDNGNMTTYEYDGVDRLARINIILPILQKNNNRVRYRLLSWG